MDSVKSIPLKEWEIGKRFVVSDNKALLVIVPQSSGLFTVPPDSIKGEILLYQGIESKINAAGELVANLIFTDRAYIYTYDSARETDYAWENLLSDQVPMLIDEEMVTQARNLLRGKKVWSRTNLWYDEEGRRIEGRKYVEVEITDVTPGDMVFPLKLKIKDEDNNTAFLYMNFGSSDTESRAFHNLFSLSDIRKHYHSIEPETWDLISRAKIKEGMTKEEVRLSIGTPNDINSGHDYSQTLDIWTYDNGRVLWFEDGKLVRIRQ